MLLHYPLNTTTGVEDSTIQWSQGVPLTGQDGSFPPLGVFNEPQTEIVNVIASVMTPSNDLTQLNQAINAKITTAVDAIQLPSITATEGVKDVSSVVSLNYPGLTSGTITDTDLIAYYSQSAGHHQSISGNALATYILAKTSNSSTFVQAANPESFSQFALGGQQGVGDNAQTTFNLQTPSGGNPPWASCTNGVITVSQDGLYQLTGYANMDVSCANNEAAYFYIVIYQSHSGGTNLVGGQSAYGNADYYLGITVSATGCAYAKAGDAFYMQGLSHAGDYDAYSNHFNTPSFLSIAKIN